MSGTSSSSVTQRISRLRGHLDGGAAVPATAVPDEGFVRRTTHTMERLQRERARASFPVREMTYFLDGGRDVTAMKETMMAQLAANPVFADKDWHDVSHAQVRERTLKRVREAYKLLISDGSDVTRRNCRLEIHALHDLGWFVRQGVHFGLFMGALSGQGSDEQRAEWLAKTMMCEIYGCFGMTELGHGSFLRGLETTAHFDKNTQEFIINSPTDTSTKWWIGAAGQTATHSVVFARLILDEGDVGVHNFIVPVRDMETHDALPGVHIGDLGAKMGLNGIDNGYMQFDHVRIPHNNMLCRYAQVTPEGSYVKPPRKEMSYGALIGTRAQLVKIAVDFHKKALMIGIRYSVMRVQGVVEDDDKVETSLLDYPIHRNKLMTLLAASYAWHFQASYVLKLNDALEEGLALGDLSILNDVHGTMAGLKAFGTWNTYNAIETCRQSAGGHGYSKYNGLSSTLQDFAVMCTWEGDNTVMALQTARYLLRSYEKSVKGEKLAGSVSYLQEATPATWRLSHPSELLDQGLQREAWVSLLSTRVRSVCDKVLQLAATTGSMTKAFTNYQVELFSCARAHVSYNVALRFMDSVGEIKDTKPALYPVLKRVCDLFSLDKLLEDSTTLLESGYANGQHVQMMRDQIQYLEVCLRPDAVSLVDAFNYSDAVLESYIGSADGDIYTRYLEKVKSLPENRPGHSRAPYYETEIKPLLSGADFPNTWEDEEEDGDQTTTTA